MKILKTPKANLVKRSDLIGRKPGRKSKSSTRRALGTTPWLIVLTVLSIAAPGLIFLWFVLVLAGYAVFLTKKL